MINFLRSKIDFKASRSPYESSNPDVKSSRYARTRVLFFRRPRRENWIRLGRQVYLYLHRSRQLRTFGTGPHWHVATAKIDGNLIQKRNTGNGAFSWKSYKDNVTVQHRK